MCPLLLGATSMVFTKYAVNLTSTSVVYQQTGANDVSWSIEVTCKGRLTLSVTLNVYNNRTESLLYNKVISHEISSTVSYYDFTIPMKNRLNSDGLKIETIHQIENISRTRSAVIYPYVKQSINALYYLHEPYVASGTFFKMKNGKFYDSESFNFENLNEYLSKSINNVLDFSSVTFNYSSKFDYRCGEIEYHIKDYNNVYPNLKKVAGEVVVGMNYSINNGEISFDIDEDMYVNHETLEMSSTMMSGYESTNRLFIPMGKEKQFEQDDSYLLIKDAGYSGTDITIPFKHYIDKKLVGECSDSDYCISGGVRE